MSIKSVKEKRQARTENAIESFENAAARSLVNTQLYIGSASQKLNEKQNLCKSNYASDLNKGIEISDASKTFKDCTNKAIDSYNTDHVIFNAQYNSDMKLLGTDLDNTLNHHLYSQDFEPYWRS